MHFSANAPQWRLCRPILKTIPSSRLGKRIGDQGIVYKIGRHNRHWGAFAEKCINNRTIRHGSKGGGGAERIVYRFRKMHLLGSKLRAVYSISLCVFFYLGWSAYLGMMSKIRVWSYYNGYITGWAWELFQWSYNILTPCLWFTCASPVVIFIVSHTDKETVI